MTTQNPASEPHPSGATARAVLVTGGAGFIGSHLVENLLQRSDRVTVIDNLSTGRRENLSDAARAAGSRLRFIEADLGEALRALGAGERFDEVYHLAAAVGVARVIERPIESIETNVIETAELLRFCLSHGPVQGVPPRVLIASSSEVYGKPARSPFSEDDDCLYGPTTASRWSYACSKAIDEYLALAYHRQRGLPTVVARLFNTVGPRQVGTYGMVLPRFVEAALRNEPLPVHGDGGQSRCFCDVRDVAPALAKLLDAGVIARTAGRLFNVGSDQPITMLDLAERVIRVLGSRSRPALIPYHQAYGEGFEDLRQRQPDLRRVREAIAFAPRVPLDQTITDLARAIRR